MYSVMKRLIQNKFYKTQEEAQQKLDVFFAMNKLDDMEYVELTELVETMYAPVAPEETPEEVPAE